MEDIIKQQLEEFEKIFGKLFDFYGDILMPSKEGVWKDEVKKFLKQALEKVRAEAKQNMITKLKKIDGEKWGDSCHCTCLGYAITIITNDEEYHPKNYKYEDLTPPTK